MSTGVTVTGGADRFVSTIGESKPGPPLVAPLRKVRARCYGWAANEGGGIDVRNRGTCARTTRQPGSAGRGHDEPRVRGGPGLSTWVPDVPREPPERSADRGGLRGSGRLRPERRRPRPAPALPRISGLARRRTRMVRRRVDGGSNGERVARNARYFD